jgi:Protein of unknown function (DUF3987)
VVVDKWNALLAEADAELEAIADERAASVTTGAEGVESAERGSKGGFPRLERLPRRQEWTPPRLPLEALHGPAGAWAEAVYPFTEASTAGVLVSTLLSFGSAVGHSAYVQVGAIRHHANEYAALVGPTASGRKGEAMYLGALPIRAADEGWTSRILGGFGSGEAVVVEVRDPESEQGEQGERIPDAGSEDERLLVREDELASVLAVASRDGSTLSALLRRAWDGLLPLENRTKARRIVASRHHVSALAAITPDELVRRVPETEIANGFLNRFLLVAVKRSHHLAEPPPLQGDLEAEYVEAFRVALLAARRRGALARDQEARARWAEVYESDLAIDRYGLAGAACSRAEAHATRLSLVYALLDRSPAIRLEHVEAALGLWSYCERSTYLIFGDRLGNAVADAILEALADATPEGLTRDELRDVFSRHRTAAELDNALALLLNEQRISEHREPTGGRPATRYLLATNNDGRDGGQEGGRP